jgi:hypothetical protein
MARKWVNLVATVVALTGGGFLALTPPVLADHEPGHCCTPGGSCCNGENCCASDVGVCWANCPEN